jgi:hypothetical protein
MGPSILGWQRTIVARSRAGEAGSQKRKGTPFVSALRAAAITR